MNHWTRLAWALSLLLAILVFGTFGYLAFGFGFVDAMYQTVTTVATVGFREVHPLSTGGKFFTMILILVGVSSTLYAFSILIETLIEGRLADSLGRHRMERSINTMQGHIVICGWGRVGRSIASEVDEADRKLVVIDLDPDRLAGCPYPSVLGDATEDATLAAAGIERASALIAAVDADAANSFIILSARAACPELFIVARARSADSEEKLRRAGADRVVNPQHIGGTRMAAFVLRPHVAEFVDVVMRDRNLEFRLEELAVGPASPIARKSMREARIRDRTGALVLAVREAGGQLRTNPPPETTIEAGDLLIAIGTESELRALADLVDDDQG